MTTEIKELKEFYDLAKTHYTRAHKKMDLLDSADRGLMWKALEVKFPPYQILPDTNFVTYVKNNILASNYTVMKAADLQPTSEEDKDIVTKLNIAIDRVWDLSRIGFHQFQAGERAALLNLGITQVGWNEDLVCGSIDGHFYKGNVSVKNIDPKKFMRDPFAIDLDAAQYCIYYDRFHKSFFLKHPKYREAFEKYEAKAKAATPLVIPEYTTNATIPKGNAKGYYALVIFWVREGKNIHEIHTVDCEEILYKKENIKPAMFPFAELFCNLPAGELVGVSETAKIFANNVAHNLMDSIALTAEYKNQRPPKFVSSSSGLNIQQFAKHGDEADKTFVVNGDATRAVHYHEFPQVSAAMADMKKSLQWNIQLVSGVDGRYTGRDTGSITTTGGTEEMLNRVTLIDTPKIVTYENYCRRLTQLIVSNMIRHSPKRKYFYKKPDTTTWSSVEIDFPEIDNDTFFDYAINISSELPKNKQRVASMANMLMEKQMQYEQQGDSVQLITEEEWLMFQDLPNKEFMLERMGIQRERNALEDVSQVLFEYAELMKQGMNPDEAMNATAHSLDQKRQGIMPGQEQGGMMPGGMGGMPGMM